MLTNLRDGSKNSIVKIVLGTLLTILIISFAMWGTEDLVGVNKKQTTVASVGSIDISSREFYSLYTRQTKEIRKLLGSALSIEKSREFGYVDRALGSLINRALFNNEAIELAKEALNQNPNYFFQQYQKEQLWGEKLQTAGIELFKNPKLKSVINTASANSNFSNEKDQ